LYTSWYAPDLISETISDMGVEFFQMFYVKHPVYAPSTTPIYSNAAFQILAYALENITGISFPDMLQTDMIDKLHLSDTSYSKPKNDSRGVIFSSDRSPATSFWDLDLADITP
jgi:CubicO group peptidase (beta-lactamase class C family)